MGEIMRGPDGRFLPGTPSPNPLGRKPSQWQSEVQQHYYELMAGAVSDQDWLDIVALAVEQAKSGPGASTARKWLSQWLMPSANQMEILRLSHEEKHVLIKVQFGNDESEVIDL